MPPTMPPSISTPATNIPTYLYEWQSPEFEVGEARCPNGWVRQPQTNRCYTVLLEGLTWANAQARCNQAANRAHLVVIEDDASNNFIVNHLTSFDATDTIPCREGGSSSLSFYTAGQRLIVGDCSSTFYWRPRPGVTDTMLYTKWPPGQPDCGASVPGGSAESCLHFTSANSYNWNDVGCAITGCPLCQVTI
jgi:hypothetical protein